MNHALQVLLSATLLLPAMTSPASADGLTMREQQYVKSQRAMLADSTSVRATQRDCGFSVETTFDDELATPFVNANRSIAGYCESGINAIYQRCSNPVEREAMKRNIKAIHCRLAKSDKMAFDFKDGVLTIYLNENSINREDKVGAFIENNLR